MKRTIFKYAIRPDVPVILPKDWKFLSLEAQGSEIVLYASVPLDQHAPKDKLNVDFKVYGTGWEIQDCQIENLIFLGTTMLTNGLVFHVFIDDSWLGHL